MKLLGCFTLLFVACLAVDEDFESHLTKINPYTIDARTPLRIAKQEVTYRMDMDGIIADLITGRLEAQMNVYDPATGSNRDMWGPFCDDAFYDDAAEVACKHMGYDKVVYYHGKRYQPAFGPIMFETVYCHGDPANLNTLADCDTYGKAPMTDLLGHCHSDQVVEITCLAELHDSPNEMDSLLEDMPNRQAA